MAERVNDLLLPIVKGVGSERAYQCLTESLQTLGGSGFLQDYPIEQYIRDAKIDSLYEGTTAIQAQDYFFRKIARDQGRALAHVVSQITDLLGSDTARPELADGRTLLATALGDMQGMVAAMTGYLMGAQENARELYRLGLESVRFLLAVGDLLIGWLLLNQAEIALNALGGRGLRSRPCVLHRKGRRGKVFHEERVSGRDQPAFSTATSAAATAKNLFAPSCRTVLMLKASASNSASLSVTPAKAAGDASRISLSALSS